MVPVKVERIMQIIGLDIVGPFPRSKSGHEYVIVAVEYLSRYIIAAPLRSTSALEAAKFVINDIFLKYGVPERLNTDNETTFTAEFFEQLVEFSGVCKTYSSVIHSTGNALVEKSIGLITRILKAHCQSDPTNWSASLASAVFSYNTSFHSTTKYSPAFLMFGRNPHHPEELMLPLTSTNTDAAAYLRQLHRSRKLALQCIQEQLKEQKLKYDSSHSNVEYEEAQ